MAVVVLTALWFKGGEFLCRLRGGNWVDTYLNSACVTYQGE